MTKHSVTKCEAEIMDIVWDKRQVTVGEVVESLDRKLAYTTVLTTMSILEEKGILKRGGKIGRAYTYLPAVSREAVGKRMVRELTDQLFGGSVRSFVLSLLDNDSITPEDLAAVREAADRAEQQK